MAALVLLLQVMPPSAVYAETVFGRPRGRASRAHQHDTLRRPDGTRSSTTDDTLRLTLEAARLRALRVNPDLRAARLLIAIARGGVRQASVPLRSNPSLDVLTGGIGTELGLTQEIEIAGQRGARHSAALAGVERATASVLNVVRLTIGEVDRTFYRYAVATQRVQLTTEVLALNRRLLDVAARQLAVGRISPLEYNLAIVESGRSEARALRAERERDQTAQQLRRLLGLAPDRAVVSLIALAAAPAAVPPTDSARAPVLHVPRDSETSITRARAIDSLNVDSLTVVALRRRPDLRERAAAAAQSRGLATVARREAFPNLAFRVASERLENTGHRALRPGVGLTVPVFNRNQGEVEARQAEADQAELERAAIVVGVRASVAAAVAAYATATAEVTVFETTVLAPARENRRLLEVAFREGKVGIPVLLLIRNQVIDAELEYGQAWLAAREALAGLVEATGEVVAPALTSAALSSTREGEEATKRLAPAGR
ncbi:MAG: TolC family protein [Gemmatimonadetes bacterium]|nr:TolC family protein [Gemmatimonadota bacterium]